MCEQTQDLRAGREKINFKNKRTSTTFAPAPLPPPPRKPPNIIYCTRTHSQMDQCVKELRRSPYRPVMTVLASRKRLCIHDAVTNSDDRSVFNLSQMCRAARRGNRRNNGTTTEGGGGGEERVSTCRHWKTLGETEYGVELRKELLPSSLMNAKKTNKETNQGCHDIEDLREFGSANNGCPYFTSQAILESGAQLIFCPYQYVVNPGMRETLGINIDGSIIVIDEAHNIEDTCREAGSIDVTTNSLLEIMRDLCILHAHFEDKTLPQEAESARRLMLFYERILQWLLIKGAKFEQTDAATKEKDRLERNMGTGFFGGGRGRGRGGRGGRGGRYGGGGGGGGGGGRRRGRGKDAGPPRELPVLQRGGGLRPPELQQHRDEMSEIRKLLRKDTTNVQLMQRLTFLENEYIRLNHQPTSIVYKMLHDELDWNDRTGPQLKQWAETVSLGIDQINRRLKIQVPARAFREVGLSLLMVLQLMYDHPLEYYSVITAVNQKPGKGGTGGTGGMDAAVKLPGHSARDFNGSSHLKCTHQHGRLLQHSTDQQAPVWNYTWSCWLMTPALIFEPLSQQAGSIVLASGTLAPMTSFKSELGSDFAARLSPSSTMEGLHVINVKRQLFAGILENGPSGVRIDGSYKARQAMKERVRDARPAFNIGGGGGSSGSSSSGSSSSSSGGSQQSSSSGAAAPVTYAMEIGRIVYYTLESIPRDGGVLVRDHYFFLLFF